MRPGTLYLALSIGLAGATGFAIFHDDLASASGPVDASRRAAPPLESPGSTDDESESPLPPDHPPIGTGLIAPGGEGDIAPSDLAPAITWTAPTGWPSAPNPSALRIATYKIPRTAGDKEDAELAVSRAGGDIEANVERWGEQFQAAGQAGEAAQPARRGKTVHGFAITIVEVEGTYQGGMGSAGALRPGWALLGAIVVAPEQPYFFKLTGPAATVRAARAGFEALVESIAAAAAPPASAGAPRAPGSSSGRLSPAP